MKSTVAAGPTPPTMPILYGLRAGAKPVEGDGVVGIGLVAVDDRDVERRRSGVDDDGDFGEAGNDDLRALVDDVAARPLDELDGLGRAGSRP